MGPDRSGTVNRYLSVVGDSPVDSLRGTSPIVGRVVNRAAEAAFGPRATMKLVIDESVLDASTAEYPDALRQAVELDRLSLYLHPDRVEFGMALVDGHASVDAYDAGGNAVASVDGTDDFLERATDVYADYRARSREHDPADAPP